MKILIKQNPLLADATWLYLKQRFNYNLQFGGCSSHDFIRLEKEPKEVGEQDFQWVVVSGMLAELADQQSLFSSDNGFGDRKALDTLRRVFSSPGRRHSRSKMMASSIVALEFPRQVALLPAPSPTVFRVEFNDIFESHASVKEAFVVGEPTKMAHELFRVLVRR